MNKKFYISIKFKLTSVITLLVGTISLFVFIYFPQKFETERMESLHEKADAVAKLAAYGIASGLYFEDESASQEEIEKLIENEEIRYVVIYKGDSLYYNYNIFSAVLSEYDIIDENYVSEKWQILKSYAPVIVNNEKIGDIYIGYSLAQVFAKMKELKQSIGIMSLILFIVGAALVYLVGYYFTQPLTDMVSTVKSIGEGDFSKRTEVTSRDEVGILGNAFNEMLDKIQNTSAEMEVINKELEARVKERTNELEKALKSLQKENEVRKNAEQKISGSLKEKEVLLKEIHHRVKNNLQIVSSLFFFQSKKISDPSTLEMFREGQNRVKSMALIHEKLYQSDDLANIDFKEYVKKLGNFLLQSYSVNQSKFKFKNNVGNVQLSVDTAVPCGLIINELISNAFKHGFKNKDSGEIKIDMDYDENNKLVLKLSDNGWGIPTNLNIAESDSLGLRLVNNLTIQLNGKVEFFNRNGTTVKITFEDPKYRKAA